MLAPNGVEEERGPGYVEYAIYGGEGELPELGEIEAATGDGLVEVISTEVPDDWADRWQDFHKPLLVGGRLWLRPSWEEPREDVDRPGRRSRPRLRHRRPPDHPALPRAAARAGGGGRGRRSAHRSRHRLRRAGDRRREARLGPGPRLRPRGAGARGRSGERRGQRRRGRAWSTSTCASASLPSPRRRSPTSPPRSSARSPPSWLRRGAGGGLVGASPLLLRRVLPRLPPHARLLGPAPLRARRGRRRLRRLRPRRGRPPPRGRLGRAAAASRLSAFCRRVEYLSRRCWRRSPATASASSFTSSPSCSPSGRPSATRCSSRSRRSIPQATPALMAGVQKIGPLPGQPGHDRPAPRRHLPARRQAPGRASEAFIAVGFVAILALFGLQHGFFQPQVRKAKELAERDLQSGDALSDEFLAVSQRIGQVGTLAGLIVVVTIFFMVVQTLTPLSVPAPQLDASLPIAMFDSGVGGLTVLHECLVSLPEEDFVYLGDTAMFPYGTRDPDRLRERIGRDRRAAARRWGQAAGDRLQHGDLDRRGRGARGCRGARGGGRPRGRAAGRDRGGDHRQRPGRRAGDAEHGRRAAPTAARWKSRAARSR